MPGTLRRSRHRTIEGPDPRRDSLRGTARYGISRNGQKVIVEVDQVEAIEPAIRPSEPGLYHVGSSQRG